MDAFKATAWVAIVPAICVEHKCTMITGTYLLLGGMYLARLKIGIYQLPKEDKRGTSKALSDESNIEAFNSDVLAACRSQSLANQAGDAQIDDRVLEYVRVSTRWCNQIMVAPVAAYSRKSHPEHIL